MNLDIFSKVPYLIFFTKPSSINIDTITKKKIDVQKNSLELLIEDLNQKNELINFPFLEAISRLKNYRDSSRENYNIEENKEKLIKKEIGTLSRFSVFRYLKIEE